MLNLKNTLAAFSVAALVFSGLSASPALAEDEESAKNMRLVTIIEVNPAKEKEWREAWGEVREMALEHGYDHSLFVAANRNKRWLVNEIENFAGADAIFKSRGEVYEKGGKKFAKAVAKLQSSEMTNRSFFARHDPELSHWPEGQSTGPAMEFDTFSYRMGKGEAMNGLLEDYKALAIEVGVSGYQVFWNGIGSEGNSITIVSYGESPLALAQAEAADQTALEGNEKMGAIIERFLEISLSSVTEEGMQQPDLSIVVAE